MLNHQETIVGQLLVPNNPKHKTTKHQNTEKTTKTATKQSWKGNTKTEMLSTTPKATQTTSWKNAKPEKIKPTKTKKTSEKKTTTTLNSGSF